MSCIQGKYFNLRSAFMESRESVSALAENRFAGALSASWVFK